MPKGKAAEMSAEEKAAKSAAAKAERGEKFRELGAKRMGTALNAIRLIGNMSNRSSYDYTEEQVAIMSKTLHQAVTDVMAKFEPKGASEKPTFSW